jgi:hypothetical protein
MLPTERAGPRDLAPIVTTETERAFAGLLAEVAATHVRIVEQLRDDATTLLEAHK